MLKHGAGIVVKNKSIAYIAGHCLRKAGCPTGLVVWTLQQLNNKSIAYILACRSLLEEGRLSYRASGVDITAADALVSTIKRTAALTNRTGVCGSIGGFGGLFDTKAAGYRDPLLVSGTDGVGTKLKVDAGSCFRGTYFLHLQGKRVS
jgi:hypothetical protein